MKEEGSDPSLPSRSVPFLSAFSVFSVVNPSEFGLMESPMDFRRARSTLLLLAVAFVAVACGKGAPPPPPTAAQVFVHAMKALEAGNLADLESCLSPRGRDQVRRDLQAWRASLVDAIEGPRLLARLQSGTAAPAKALIDKAMVGDPASVLALLVAIEPHPWGSTPAPPEPPASPAQYLYRAANGAQSPVILTRAGDS